MTRFDYIFSKTLRYFLQITNRHQRILTALVLISMLSLSTGVTLGCQTSVAPTDSPSTGDVSEKNAKSPSSSLPSAVTDNEEASNLTDAELPDSVAQAVLQEASKQSILPIAQLKITQAQQQTWPDGCLGISSPDTLCTQALVTGWRVRVEDQGQSFIYRTNDSGSVVKLEKTPAQLPTESSLPDTVILAVQTPQRELPPPLPQNTIFRVITSGGFTGRTYETTLLKNGQVMQAFVNFNGTAASPRISRISSQEVQQFQQLLEKVDFAQFKQLSYPPPIGAADYVTVVMTSQRGTTSYADMVQHQLPESLKTVIQAWNKITTF
ncbi:MAG: hypothetical protein F6J96_11895 [Symploca sp. SIO1C2]|nr:hypothetical protein [Symploca sp. SIO1C2]